MWSGLTYAQAAEALDVPVGTIRSRLSRARSRLQELGRSELEAMRAAPMELNEACGQGVSVCTGILGPEKERG
jgi:RNA polymerase sigma-70 factor (ECF subfamily)